MRTVFLFLGILILVGMVYLISRFRRLQPEHMAMRHRAISWLLAAASVAAVALACYIAFNVFTMVIILLHMILAWLLCDFAVLLVKKLGKRQLSRSCSGIAALLLIVLYLGAGWFFAHHVYQTNYAFSTDKDLGGESLRIVGIADAHLGITLDGERFGRQMQRIQEINPDLVVIVGDFVDDDTGKADMIEACRVLGRLETTYGVYFVFGNHDEGYYRYRDFTSQELRTALTENHVTILEDEVVPINDSVSLAGRRDRSTWNRMAAGELVAGIDQSKFVIMLDHQPNDYVGEASNADLVLSGHTHGGHIFPAGLIGLAMGANDRAYGTEQRGGTNFVVTSGISGWAIPFKTGAISEYVVIDIVEAE